MSMIPSSLTRVPNMLAARVGVAQINRTNLALFRVTEQLSTGLAVIRPSDDAVKAAALLELESRLARTEQRSRNLDAARSTLATLDDALSQAQDLLLEAKSTAQAQIGIGSNPEERATQATIIESLTSGLLRLANTSTILGHVFAGDTPGRPPVESFLGGYRFRASGEGMLADLGLGDSVRLTLGDNGPLGTSSARVRGTADLNPGLTLDTRLADLDGARGLGIDRGIVEFSYDGGPRVSVDLSTADTVGQVAARLTASIRQHETQTGRTILGAGGVGVADGAFSNDLASPGGSSPQLRFFDTGAGTTARDLGLADDSSFAFTPAASQGIETNPRLTWLTPIDALRGIGGSPLGAIRLSAHGHTRTVDLGAASTMQDVRNLIEGSGLGLRVEIAPDGTVSVRNTVAGGAATGLAIEDTDGGGSTASRLGIRTLDRGTRLDAFNDGRGVTIADGGVNPDTGDPDPALDVEFVIRLGNGARIEIDLRPADVVSVGTLLDAINTRAAAQLASQGFPTTLFRASIPDHGPGGIVLTQDDTFPGMTDRLAVEPRNNNPAAFQLGLMDAHWDAASASLIGSDRAKVRVDGIFTHLADLREALLKDDTPGIALASEGIERALERLAQSRALVGGYSTRVDREVDTVEQRRVLDETFRSRLRDADYAEVASRFALLQTQLGAGLRVAAAANSLSLLDFLR
ncbi:MAG: hypothetical protein KIS87_06700 [Phycisphaeraceae bacterium]|nr:hypothetical protein [Phycisphaeraceae bacterium]